MTGFTYHTSIALKFAKNGVGIPESLQKAIWASLFFLLVLAAMAFPAHARERFLVGYFPSWFEGDTANLAQISGGFTHVVISFADPNFRWDGKSWTGTGLQFSKPPLEVKAEIAGLKKRGIKVLLAVGGTSYLQWGPLAAEASKPGPITAALQRFLIDMAIDGIDVDYETDGSGPEQISEYRNDITALRRAAGAKILSLAAWSTGADCTQMTGAQECDGYSAAGGRTGRERLLFSLPDITRKIDMVSIMSYDAGVTNYDPVTAYALYRALLPSRIPVHIGFEPAPEGWGDATLVRDPSAANCVGSQIQKNQFGVVTNKSYSVERLLKDGPFTNRPHSNPNDGAMLWHIFKSPPQPPCGTASSISSAEVVSTLQHLLSQAVAQKRPK
jgi:hypothetical protein